MGKRVCRPLEIMSTDQVVISHMVKIVDITHVPVISFDDVGLHRVVAVITKITFWWWQVHVSQYVNINVLPNQCSQIFLGPHPDVTSFQFQFFWSTVRGMSFLVGRTVQREFILHFSKSSKSHGEEKKLSINILYYKTNVLAALDLRIVTPLV
jgi:hypothetical protein